MMCFSLKGLFKLCHPNGGMGWLGLEKMTMVYEKKKRHTNMLTLYHSRTVDTSMLTQLHMGGLITHGSIIKGFAYLFYWLNIPYEKSTRIRGQL